MLVVCHAVWSFINQSVALCIWPLKQNTKYATHRCCLRNLCVMEVKPKHCTAYSKLNLKSQSPRKYASWCIRDIHAHRFNGHLPGKPELAVCCLIVSLQSSLSWASSWDRPKFFMSSMTQFSQVFLRCPLHRVPAVSIEVHRLTQSALSLSSECQNHLNLSLTQVDRFKSQ